MNEGESVALNGLSDSARDAVADLVELLSGRFTGRIELECMEGGVRNFREIRERRSGDLGRLAQARDQE